MSLSVPQPPSASDDPGLPPAVDRPIVLVGLMGAGKSSIGRRLAARLDVPFVDADDEIAASAGCSIPEIFARYGEASFRDGERRVIARLLERGPMVLATGGGAFMDPEIRRQIAERAVSVWLKADLDVLVARTGRKPGHRPLLDAGNPRQILQRLMDERHPVYAEADITVKSRNEPHGATVEAVLSALADTLGRLSAIPPHNGPRNNPQPFPGDSRPMTRIAVAGTNEPASLSVELGERRYDILVGEGLVAAAGPVVAARLPQPRAVVVTDTNVAPLYLDVFTAGLKSAGVAVDAVVLPAGEPTKDFAHFENLVDRLLDLRVERRTTLIALGGGVIGDITGFAAAVVLRGLPFVQVPTTLLAQVDSSVGGKTGINTRHGKNLIGAFHQPQLVVADVGSLDTLPRRELLAGYAEVVKYGLIADPDFFDWLEAGHGAAIINGDRHARTRAVLASCAAKATIVAADEREAGQRALLNLGHTFGHALEAETGYGERLRHGEAVALGAVMAFELSVRLGLCPAGDAARVGAHLAAVGLPVTLAGLADSGWTAERLMVHMGADKKVQDGRLTFVLVRGIGHAFTTRDVDPDAVRAVLGGFLDGQG